MQAMKSLLNQTQLSLQDLQNGHQIATSQMHFDPSSSSPHDEDFLDQMLSSLPSSTWPDVNAKSPWDISSNTLGSSDDQFNFDHDQPSMLASKLRHHQISGGGGGPNSAAKSLLQQQQLMLQARGFGNVGDLVDPSSFTPGGDGSVQALFNGFAGSLNNNQSQFQQQTQSQNFVAAATNQAPAASGSAGGGASGQTRQRVRARRGQATDPHSIAERLRRERISERMKALQELVPNGNKTDKASMLDEIIDYVKFLQLQVKVLSMSRLGGAAPSAPVVAEGGVDCIQGIGGVNRGGASSNNGGNEGGTTVTEHQVAKMLEDDMGSAMQYLQGKGLCLMPISLATAISTATCNRNPMSSLMAASGRGADSGGGDGGGPSSPNMSALTVQSGNMGNAIGDGSA